MSLSTTHSITPNSQLHQDMQRWRHEIHQYPEIAFEEVRTSRMVAQHLAELGLEVHTGIGITGVVGVLRGKYEADRHIGLRADMDALPVQELNTFAHKSCHDGKMHACGHDGHTCMLLGAAAYLARHNDFAGTVYFIFQPAEEDPGAQEKSGALLMIEDGLFTRFPIQEVYGMHNWPALAEGEFAVHPGAVMAAADVFTIDIQGKGGHAAMPETFTDPVLVAGHMITALQSIVARNLNPTDTGLISITNLQAGTGAFNVIPESARLEGTFRVLDERQRSMIKQRMHTIVTNIAAAFDASATLDIPEGYPVTVNTPAQAQVCHQVASSLVGEDHAHWNPPPSMGAEDFAYMLQERPGAYIWIGNGQGKGSHGLHNPHYDFNDRILPLGASYWVALVMLYSPSARFEQ
jgi:hippurate hydrolase